jgi:hypothetical protein
LIPALQIQHPHYFVEYLARLANENERDRRTITSNINAGHFYRRHPRVSQRINGVLHHDFRSRIATRSSDNIRRSLDRATHIEGRSEDGVNAESTYSSDPNRNQSAVAFCAIGTTL